MIFGWQLFYMIRITDLEYHWGTRSIQPLSPCLVTYLPSSRRVAPAKLSLRQYGFLAGTVLPRICLLQSGLSDRPSDVDPDPGQGKVDCTTDLDYIRGAVSRSVRIIVRIGRFSFCRKLSDVLRAGHLLKDQIQQEQDRARSESERRRAKATSHLFRLRRHQFVTPQNGLSVLLGVWRRSRLLLRPHSRTRTRYRLVVVSSVSEPTNEPNLGPEN